MVKNKPEKDYTGVITTGSSRTGFYHYIGASLGDQISNRIIWTDSTPYGTSGKPFDTTTIIITTADRGINKFMRDALTESGFNPGIMNDDNIPAGLVNMGLEKGKDHFAHVMRANLFQNPDIGWDYIYNIDKYFTVLRITPERPYASTNPWPIPALKKKETGITEFQVVPDARNTLDHLRNQIISKYGDPKYDIVDLDLNLAITDAYEGILQDVTVWIDNRDTIRPIIADNPCYVYTQHTLLEKRNTWVVALFQIAGKVCISLLRIGFKAGFRPIIEDNPMLCLQSTHFT